MSSNHFRVFLNALMRTRAHPLRPVERWMEKLTPSDWLVVVVLGSILFVSAFVMLVSASYAVSIETPGLGGTYVEGLVGNPRFVNPLLALSETDRDLASLVYSGLLKANADGTLSPDIAESYEISDDGLTYTFTIKEGALFHDGQEITAEDVVFTVRAAQNPTIKSPRRANWEGVVVTVVDRKTVSFTLKGPFALFLENATLGILPRALWENISPEEFTFSSLNTEPVGSGPYRLQSVKRNQSGIPTEYRLRAFTRGVRVPFIENFVFRFYPNTEALMGAIDQGEVDAAHSIDPAGVNTSSELVEAIFGRVFGVFFNQNQNEVFLETSVRRALDVALDKKELVDTVLGGYGSVIDGPLPPRSIGETDVPQEGKEERIAEARSILENAGWKLGEDGIFEKRVKKETKRLSFSLSTANAPELKQTAEMVAADWRALGAEVTLQFFDNNDLNIEVLRPRKYDALLFGLVVGNDLDLFAFWHSSQRNDPGLNVALYASIDADKSLERARVLNNITERRAEVQKAAEIIKDEYAAVFLYTPHFVYLVPRTVSGITMGTIANPNDRFIAVDQWYLSKVRIWPFFSFAKNPFTANRNEVVNFFALSDKLKEKASIINFANKN